jgi:hypothetical protein
MLRTACLLMFSIVVAQMPAQQTAPPHRTITSRPDAGADASQKAEANSQAGSAALERYRAMWQKMTPAQQKALVSNGGYTPDQYEHMLKQQGMGFVEPKTGDRPRGAASPDPGGAVDADALHSLSKALQDRNAIRDGNLLLVQKDGCPPELASRIADLKAKLQGYEYELTGATAPANASGQRSIEKSGGPDALAVANEWFKRARDRQPAAAGSDSEGAGHRTRESKLLDAALAGTETGVVPERIDAKSPVAERNRKAVEDDMARVKAELEQLSGACAARK